ncbi:undecaprenyl-diphosphatase UppP [Candidatus Saccharibacteria bacterium]|nr:undecaprenyl-diphosphatase UppP [Candidatus Saccharibacteria bacterium]MCA9337738.1 undecaprenyl-diphosphatase UppP [Candidatus Saccharibacteria bacterium]
MSILQALLLGIIQGLTEFIPVSSSGHLVLAHDLLGITENGLAFDVALHLGTLVALLIYFHKDIWHLIVAVFTRQKDARLAWLLAAATVPAVIVGLLLESAAESALRAPWLVAINFVVVSIFMLSAERYYRRRVKKPTELKMVKNEQALAIGMAQALAIIPGVSRSGATITTGIFAGMDRVAATRFSFLLGIPIMIGAVIKVFSDSQTFNQFSSEMGIFITGMLAALLSGLFAIRFLLRYLSKHTLDVFAYYRLGVAAIIFIILLVRM